MTLWVDSYWGWMDYEQFQKVRNMDPGHAEAFKQEAWEKYQEKRIVDAVKDARREMEDNIESDEVNKTVYIQRFRTTVTEIPWIEKSEKYKSLYDQCMDEQWKLDLLEDQVNMITSVNSEAYQEGMDDMGTDTPDFVKESEAEKAEAAHIDAITTDPAEVNPEVVETSVEITDEPEATPEVDETAVVETKKQSIKEIQAQYKEVIGNEPPQRFKNDAEWMLWKINK